MISCSNDPDGKILSTLVTVQGQINQQILYNGNNRKAIYTDGYIWQMYFSPDGKITTIQISERDDNPIAYKWFAGFVVQTWGYREDNSPLIVNHRLRGPAVTIEYSGSGPIGTLYDQTIEEWWIYGHQIHDEEVIQYINEPTDEFEMLITMQYR